jgi:hypothetical protein
MSLRLRIDRLFLLTMLATLLGPYARAQSTAGTIEGLVLDSSGAGIVNAAVTVTNTATGIGRTVMSDSVGRYVVNNLNPGPYALHAQAPGFSRVELSDVTLEVQQDERLDLRMKTGQATETVNVEASSTMTDTETSSVGTVIDNKKIIELPLANRQFYSLALLSPAAAQPAQTSTLGFRGGFNVAGSDETNNTFIVNGTYDNDMGTLQPSFRPSVEAIQEFKLLTGNYSAEYGRTAGGQILIVTKSGTNTFHGGIYEFIRNQVTDAKPFFTAVGGVNPAFKQNTFGGIIGGPIVKDKTFFFFAYEGQRIRQQITALGTVPTPAMLAGYFAIGTTLYDPLTGVAVPLSTNPLYPGTSGYQDLSQLSGGQWTNASAQLGRAISTYYPAPTIATTLGTAPSNNYSFSETRQESMNEFSSRVDHKFNDKNSLIGTYNYFKDPSFEPSNSICGSYVIPLFGCYANQLSTQTNLSYTHIFTPQTLNEVRIGFTRLAQPRIAQGDTAITNPPVVPGAFLDPTVPENAGVPNTQVSGGFSTIGSYVTDPQERWDNHWDFINVFTYNHGKHTFKAGIDYFQVLTSEFYVLYGTGSFSYNSSSIQGVNKVGGAWDHLGTTGNSFSDLLVGVPYTSTRNPTAPRIHLGYTSNHLFVMDDWNVTPNFTFNFGMRWELDVPVYERYNIASKFNATTGLVDVAGPNTFHHFYKYDYNNFAPRIGFAWQPLGNPKTVVKMAYGVFYNAPNIYNEFQSEPAQQPFRNPQTFTSAGTPAKSTAESITLANAFPAVLAGTASTPVGVDPNYATPYMHQWSLGVQRALTKTLLFESTYVGSKGTRLPSSINVNQATPSATPSQANRPYTAYGNITYQRSVNNSQYDSLQNKLQQSFAHGVSYLLAYTYGRSIDVAGGTGSGSNSSGSPQNWMNMYAERGPSDFNIQQRLAVSPVIELPFGKNHALLNQGLAAKIVGGFQVSGIIQWQTGRPFTITDSSSNQSGSYTAADRPNLIPGQNPNAGPKTVAKWFNTSAFVLQAAGTFGNLGRNTVDGPGFTEVDATVARGFHIYERFTGQFRVEGFNLFNHPNFFNPYGAAAQFGSSTFGTIQQSYNQRELQAALKLNF